MRVLIVGRTELGQQLGEELERHGHEVRRLEGSPLDQTTLSAALDRCDAIATATGDDAVNAVVALAARRQFHVPLATAVITHPRRAEALAGLRIKVVCPTIHTARELRVDLARSEVESELLLGGGVAMCRAEVPVRLAGRRIADVERHGQVIPVAVERDGHIMLAVDELKLCEGDLLHMVVDDPGRLTELMGP